MMPILVFLTVLAALLSVSVALNSTCLLDDEFGALQSLYTSLGGPGWIWAYPTSEYGEVWDFTNNSCPCSPIWQGLTCLTLGDKYSVRTIVRNKCNLRGMLPNTIDDFVNLEELNLQNNQVSGTIPAQLGNISGLTQLQLYTNTLHGTIPSTLGQLHNLQVLSLNSNQLSGPIPQTLTNLSKVATFHLQINKLTGTIPTGICNLTKMVNFQVGTNSLHGTLPDNIGNLRELQALGANTNHLTGTVPSSICNISTLETISLYVNWLTGPIPTCIGSLWRLTGLSIMTTYMTGPLPPSIGNLSLLSTLNLRVNLFSGSLPIEIGGLKSVTLFEIQVNCLTGTVPRELGAMTSLSQFYIYENFFVGPVDRIFDPIHQRQLTQVEMNNNAFTGDFPYNIFGLPSLAVFVASVNCLHGSIPETICNSQQLNIFALDGASSAPACQNKLFPGGLGVSTYGLSKNHVTGTIPSCMYGMPNLQVLHLSGNNIRSRLSENITVGAQLSTLVLSHNQISGTLPASIQRRGWQILDLSYNKITGTLQKEFSAQQINASVGLNINRLSGKIPRALQQMRNVTILNGNIFACGYRNQGLPNTDSNYNEYQCGSNNVNAIIVTWLGLLTFTVASGLFLFYNHRSLDTIKNALEHCKQIFKQALAEFNTEGSDAATELQDVRAVLHSIRLKCCVCASVVVLILLPVYALLRAYYSTYTYLYADTLSAVFLSGETPAYVLFALWFVLVTVAIFCMDYWQVKPMAARALSVQSVRSASVFEERGTWAYSAYIALIVLGNMTIVSTVNACFVVVSITSSSSAIVAAQVALAAFKMVWSEKIMQILTASAVYVPFMGVITLHHAELKPHAVLYWPKSLVLVINNILIPILATAVVDTSCFYNAFQQAKDIVINIDSDNCTLFDCSSGECICSKSQQNTIITTYAPPFTYSYQCSSSLVRTYTAVFALLVLFETFVIPGRTVIVLVLQKYGFLEKVNDGADDADSTLWNRLIRKLVYDDVTRAYTADTRRLNVDSNMLVLINLCLILMTWGVAFPPLAVLVCLAVYVRSYHIQVGMGQRARAVKAFLLDYAKFMVDSTKLNPYFQQALIPIGLVSCLFYGLILFDTLGDAVGGIRAIWILVTMTIGPCAIYVGVKLFWKWRSKSVTNCINDSQEHVKNAHVELQSVTRPEEKEEEKTLNVLHASAV